jgi:hypothetical protein
MDTTSTLPAAPGTHTVCVYALNLESGNANPQIGCRTATTGGADSDNDPEAETAANFLSYKSTGDVPYCLTVPNPTSACVVDYLLPSGDEFSVRIAPRHLEIQLVLHRNYVDRVDKAFALLPDLAVDHGGKVAEALGKLVDVACEEAAERVGWWSRKWVKKICTSLVGKAKYYVEPLNFVSYVDKAQDGDKCVRYTLDIFLSIDGKAYDGKHCKDKG